MKERTISGLAFAALLAALACAGWSNGRQRVEPAEQIAVLRREVTDPTDRVADPSASGIYQRVAPATVLIRTLNGHGAGIIVDPKGWIVTSHHVVDGGQTDPDT